MFFENINPQPKEEKTHRQEGDSSTALKTQLILKKSNTVKSGVKLPIFWKKQ
jgi:hypothetical protein